MLQFVSLNSIMVRSNIVIVILLLDETDFYEKV